MDERLEEFVAAETARNQKVIDTVTAAPFEWYETRTHLKFRLQEPVKIERTRGAFVNLYAVEIELAVTSLDAPGDKPYTEVRGLCHELTARGKEDRRKEKSWRYLPDEVGQSILDAHRFKAVEG